MLSLALSQGATLMTTKKPNKLNLTEQIRFAVTSQPGLSVKDLASRFGVNRQFMAGFLSGSLELRMKSTGKQALTDVNVSGIAVNGDRQVIAKVGSLGPQKRSEVVVLPLSEIEKFSGLVVTTQQHVGDVVYFGDCLKNL